VLTEETGSLLFRARRRIFEASQQRLESCGESIHVLQVLWHLASRGELTQRNLAQLTGQHPAGISRTLDELERRGLVKRTRGSDRRCLLASLTRPGRALHERLQPAFRDSVDEALAPLDERNLRELHRLLLAVCGEAPLR
jgi:DNA-binding MarR family transcriptional regulator